MYDHACSRQAVAVPQIVTNTWSARCWNVLSLHLMAALSFNGSKKSRITTFELNDDQCCVRCLRPGILFASGRLEYCFGTRRIINTRHVLFMLGSMGQMGNFSRTEKCHSID